MAANWSRMVHGIGDLHAGGVELKRVSALLDDAKKLKKPALHLQIGDATQHGLPEEDVLARKWLGRLPAPHHTVLGNHDLMDDKRTPQQWAQAYGYPSPNHVIDELPFVRIICVAPDRDGKKEQSGTLSDATLEWMSAQLESAGRDCWIACHWPLRKTVMGHPKTHYTSDMTSFFAQPDGKIRALLAGHPSAKAWLSGHTHSPIRAPGLVTRARLAPNRSILAVNFSGIVYTGNKRHTQDPVRSVYLTHLPGKVEVRFRDHVKRQWMAVGGKRVVTVKV